MSGHDIITIAACLQHMQAGKPFTVTFLTYDRNRKRGGQLRTVRAKLLQKEKVEFAGSEREFTETEKKLGQLDGSKRPNHQKWYTRNIVQLVDGHESSIIIKVHPPLFHEFEGKTVVP